MSTPTKEVICLIRERDLVVVFAYPQFESMLGYGEGDLRQRPLSEITRLQDANWECDFKSQMLFQLHKSGKAAGEIQYVKKNGDLCLCGVHLTELAHPTFGKIWICANKEIIAEDRTNDPAESLVRSIAELKMDIADLKSQVYPALLSLSELILEMERSLAKTLKKDDFDLKITKKIPRSELTSDLGIDQTLS